MKLNLLFSLIICLLIVGCSGTDKKQQTTKYQRFEVKEIVERLQDNLVIKVSLNKYGAKRVVSLEWRNVPQRTVITFEIIDWQDDSHSDYLHHHETAQNKGQSIGFYRGGGVVPFINMYSLSTGQELINPKAIKNIHVDETGIVYMNPYLNGLQDRFRFTQAKDYRLNRMFIEADKILIYSRKNIAFRDNSRIMEYVNKFATRQIKEYPKLWETTQK